MAMAPSHTVRTPSHRTMWVLGLVAAVAVGAIVWTVLDRPTLAEQRDALLAIDGPDIGQGPQFLRFRTAPVAGGRAGLTSIYTDQSGYDLYLYAETEAAEAEFRDNLADYDRWPEAQEINTWNASERCFSAREAFYCFGFDGNRAFRSYTWQSSDPDGLDALLLLRTARKHWYRFFPRS